MPQAETIAPLELIVNRTFNASRERVFRAWTEPAQIDRWFKCDPSAIVKSSVDLRVGGAYRIAMFKGDREFGVHGTYREICRPERLMFTWTAIGLEDAAGGRTGAEETLVTVEFFEVGDKTQVTLTHQHFSDANDRDRHMQGWVACFNHIESIL